MLKKFIITLFPLLICLKTIALDMVLQQRAEVFLMSQEIQKEQNPMKKLRNTAQILSAKYTELFVRHKDQDKAYEFAYNTLLKCMILSTINHERRQDWEEETEIPFAFKGFTFNQGYSSQGNDLFDKISTSIVWLLMHAFEIHYSEGHSQDQFREFWNRILHWTSMARAAITLLSTENIPLGYERDTNQGFPGLFTTRRLQEPWLLSTQLDAMWKYLFSWNGDDSFSCYGGMLSHGYIRVSHSEAHASTIAFDSFQKAFYFAYRIRLTSAANPHRAPELAESLLSLIYDMSWSSTCERGQAAMMNWVIHALALWAGYEIHLPDKNTPIFANTLRALDNKLPTEGEENLSFLSKYYSQPDVIALCSPIQHIFLRHYALRLEKRDKILLNGLWQSPLVDKLPQTLELSFKTIYSLSNMLSSLRDGNLINELRICNIFNRDFEPCSYEEYHNILKQALLKCPNISKLVISRFSLEIIRTINLLASKLNTLELNELERIDGVNEDAPEMQINRLIIKNNHYSPSGFPFVFPEEGFKLLDKTLPKISFLELPFGKVYARTKTSPVQMPSFWKKMLCLKEIQLTHSQKDFISINKTYNLPFILKLLSFCPVLNSIQVHENPIVFSGSSNLSFQTGNLSNWRLLNISNCIQTLSLNISNLVSIKDQFWGFFDLLNTLSQDCTNLEILDLSQNNLHCLPGWQNHVAKFLPNLKTLYNITPMSMFSNQSNLQNKTTVDWRSLPNSKVVPDGTRCICQNNNREIALYTHPLLERRLVRVPTGDRNNWCAIYALGLENNQQARNIIAAYNGAFIDAYDGLFWNQMVNILNAPIEIYRALDFGRADSLNGTLELVARYGSGTEEPRRVFARFGHYNALLDGINPDAVVTFMNNQTGQGNLTF